MTAPAASVVVATRNRAVRLRALLESLAAQRADDFEVVVVDDASTDDTPSVLADPPAGLAVRGITRARAGGPAAARNQGVRAARGRLVAFTDDDCVADAGWLAALLAAHGREPEALLQGLTEPMPEEAGRIRAFARTQHITGLGPRFETCNVAYPRALLERLGGFDESFPHWAEDCDLAWRAQEDGAPAVFVPDAVVRHAVHTPGAIALVRESPRWTDAVRAYARHPGLRASLHRGIFWTRRHEELLGAAAALALARRTRGASLALAVPYLRWVRSQHGSWPGGLAALPAHVAVDGAEMAGVVRGALRERILVL